MKSGSTHPVLHDFSSESLPSQSKYVDAFIYKGGLHLRTMDNKIELVDHIPIAYEDPSVHGIRPKKNKEIDILNHFIIHNGLQFEYQQPITIAYDIETYDEVDTATLPKASLPTSHISCICATVQVGEDREDYQWACHPTFPSGTRNGTRFFNKEAPMINNFVEMVKYHSRVAPVFLVGYNSSMDNKKVDFDNKDTKTAKTPKKAVDYGYDLPFILGRCGLTTNIQVHYINGLPGIAFTDLFGLGVYHIDLQKWLMRDTKFDPIQPEDHKLNSYLSLFRLGLKMNDDLDLGELHRICKDPSSGDYNKVLRYCSYDASCLLDIMSLRQYYDKLKAFQSVSGVPLSYIVFKNPTSSVLFSQATALYRTNIPFNFYAGETSTKYRGAFNQDHTAEHLAKTYSMMFDYKSLYPTAIISAYISPWTLVGEFDQLPIEYMDETAFSVLHNDPSDKNIYDDGIKEWIVYRKDPRDVFIQTIKDLLDKRQEHQDAMKRCERGSTEYAYHNQLQLAFKTMANSIYGLTGCAGVCYWFKKVVASSVSLAGRISILHARDVAKDYGEIIFVDTDSCCIEIDEGKLHSRGITPALPSNDAAYNAFTAALADQINTRLRERLPSSWSHTRFLFQYENTFTRAYFPMAKKIYSKLTLIPNSGGKTYFSCKGLQFNNLHHEVKAITLRFMEEMLMCNQDQWQSHLSDFMAARLREIDADPRRFSIRYKLGGKSGVALSIRNRFPDIVLENSDVWVVIADTMEKKKSARCVPVDKIPDGFKYDAFEMFIANFQRNLNAFFPEFKTLLPDKSVFRGKGLILDTESLNIRTEPEMVFSTCSYKHIHQLIPSNKSIHEIIPTDRVRAFFDIDAAFSLTNPTHTFDLDTFLFRVESMTGWREPVVLTAHSLYKTSFHIIYPIVVQLKYMQRLAKILFKTFPAVDTGVYTIGHSLRLPACPKYNHETKQMDERRFQFHSNYAMGKTYEDCLITNIDGLPEDPNHSFIFNSQPLIDLHGQPPSILKKLPPFITSELKRIMGKTAFKLLPTGNNNMLRMEIKKKPWNCPICLRSHQHDNPVIIRSGEKEFRLKCFRGNSDGKADITMTVPKESKDEKIDRRDDMEEWTKSIHFPYAKADQYIDFDITKRITFIKSALGTGKTHRLIELLPQYERTVYVSCRRTLSSYMKGQLEGFEDYREIPDSKINLLAKPKVIIQVDAIQRLMMDSIPAIDLLVLDEIESIISQLHNARTCQGIYSQFRKLLSMSKRIIVMDGCLNHSTMSFIQHMIRGGSQSNIDSEYILNAFEPFRYSSDVYQVHANSKRSIGHIMMTIRRLLESGKKVVCPITNASLAIQIAEQFREDYKVDMFNGRDEMNAIGSDEKMFVHKRDAFIDINAYIESTKPDLLLYTTTMTAGVSIDCHWFDEMVAFYDTKINPIDFIQSTARVRHLRSSHVTLYVQASESIANTSMFQVLDDLHLLNDCSFNGGRLDYNTQMDVWMSARNGMLLKNAWKFVLQELKRLGYSFIFHSRSETDDPTIPPIPPMGKDREAVVQSILTEKMVEIFKSVDNRKRDCLAEEGLPDLVAARYRFNIMRTMKISREECNTLPHDVVKAMVSDSAIEKVRAKIKNYRDTYMGMNYPTRVEAIREILSLSPTGIVWPDRDRNEAINEASKVCQTLKAANSISDATGLGVKSNAPLVDATRKKIAEETYKRIRERLDKTGGKIVYNATSQKRHKADPTEALDEDTQLVNELSGWIGTEAYRGAIGKARMPDDPLKHMETFLNAMGPTIKKEHKQIKRTIDLPDGKKKQLRDRFTTITFPFIQPAQ